MDFPEIPDYREGYSMKIAGVQLNRPDMEDIATDLGVEFRDVLTKNGKLTVYNTSKECQAIIDDNALVAFVAMALEIPVENITELIEVKASEDDI